MLHLIILPDSTSCLSPQIPDVIYSQEDASERERERSELHIIIMHLRVSEVSEAEFIPSRLQMCFQLTVLRSFLRSVQATLQSRKREQIQFLFCVVFLRRRELLPSNWRNRSDRLA